MKSNEQSPKVGLGSQISNLCQRCCQKIVAQIGRVKAEMLIESRGILKAHGRMLELALNEAEALAWQTAYPHLLFPALAGEKIQAVSDWTRRQRSVWRVGPILEQAAVSAQGVW